MLKLTASQIEAAQQELRVDRNITIEGARFALDCADKTVNVYLAGLAKSGFMGLRGKDPAQIEAFINQHRHDNSVTKRAWSMLHHLTKGRTYWQAIVAVLEEEQGD